MKRNQCRSGMTDFLVLIDGVIETDSGCNRPRQGSRQPGAFQFCNGSAEYCLWPREPLEQLSSPPRPESLDHAQSEPVKFLFRR
jgi:hypothetical protein